jgi:iron(III) transport system ATP-binding protein
MHEGRIAQEGSPRELYEAPVSSFIADFIGDANVVACEVIDIIGGDALIAVGKLEQRVPHRGARRGPAKLAIRPNAIILEAEDSAALGGFIRTAAYLGDHVEYQVETEVGPLFVVDAAVNRALPPTTRVSVGFQERGLALINS